MGKWTRALYQPSIPMGKDGKRVTASKEHLTLSKEAAKEGMVLLKNNGGVLPLEAGSRIAVFGKACFDYVKGGGGSGDVTVAYTRNLMEGFVAQEGISVMQELSDFYSAYVSEQYRQDKKPGEPIEPEVPEDIFKKAKAYTDTAVIALCRFSGEGDDRKPEDFYLSKEEKAMIDLVKENFNKVAVVINSGGIIDTSWFVDDDKIQSVIFACQGGIEGGMAMAELLCGKGNPSGKLADTFAASLEDYPSTAGFNESEKYVDYTEDIYVGYRYFETMDKKVNYPFGYGLSYTTFDISIYDTDETDGIIRAAVDVTNTGDREGKEVIQLYYEAPQGVLGKPIRQLGGFAKTRSLKAGETQRIIIELPVADMASYDDLGKITKSAYILEKGEYYIYAGNSVKDCNLIYTYTVNENTVTKQLSEKLAPHSLAKRLLADGTYEELPQREPVDTDANIMRHMTDEEGECIFPQEFGRDAFCVLNKPEKHQLMEVVCGDMTLDEFMAELTDSDAARLLGGQPNLGVANTLGFGNLKEYGVPNIMTADGPAGLRIGPECGVVTTAWPCATMIACSFNTELARAVGAAGAAEVKENNISVWLTPAINIHRNPLCGRNFEYYSEDPLLAGKMAAAAVSGIQSQNVAATVKHFALNNKEDNRKDSDSRVSERAAREIYLKGFEIAVKESDPWCIMSSYNVINGCRASENRELLTDILRGEWNFGGAVTTDWWTHGEQYKEVKAGNDIKMGCGYVDRLLYAVEKGELTRAEMDICAKRVLELVMKID